MVSFFLKKIKLFDVLFFILAFYPLLKFNLSSITLFVLCFYTIYKSYKDQTLALTKKNVKLFFFFSVYFIIILISITYSENKEDAIKRTTRLIPLLIIPAILIFCKPKISIEKRTNILNVFLGVNLIYIFILFSIYLFYIKTSSITNMSFSELTSNRDKLHFILNEYLGQDMLNFHKAYFSMGLVVLAIFSLHESFTYLNTNKIRGLFYMLFFFFFSFFLLLLFSFPNVIDFIFSIIVFVIYNFKNFELKKLSIFLISMIVICGISLGTYLKSDDIDVKRGFNFVESILKKENIELNDPRIEIYKSVNSLYQKASINEVLFGYGIGDVQDKLDDEYQIRLENDKNKNILLFNEEFDDDYWFKNNINITPNILKSPSGLLKADAVKEKQTTVESSYNISNKFFSDQKKQYTFSVYAKKGTAKHLILRLGNIEQRAFFDLEKGTQKAYSNLVNSEILKEKEWYRCSITTQIKGETLILVGISNKENQYKYYGNNKELYLWGAQLEKGVDLSSYVKNGSELLKYISERHLNTHNNYLYFLFAGGIFCGLSFLLAIGILFFISFRNKDVFQLTFCFILAFNFLTENILSRHLGIIFISFMVLIFFTNSQNKIGTEI